MSLHTREFLASILDVMAEALTQCWMTADLTSERCTAPVLAALKGRIAEAGDALSELLAGLASQLTEVAKALPAPSCTDLQLPPPRGRPLFEPPVIRGLDMTLPAWIPKLRSALRYVAQKRIEEALRVPMGDLLGVHGDALRVWGLSHLDALSEQFELAIAPLEGSERSRTLPQGVSADTDAIRRDLERLREWPEAMPDRLDETLAQDETCVLKRTH